MCRQDSNKNKGGRLALYDNEVFDGQEIWCNIICVKIKLGMNNRKDVREIVVIICYSPPGAGLRIDMVFYKVLGDFSKKGNCVIMEASPASP